MCKKHFDCHMLSGSPGCALHKLGADESPPCPMTSLLMSCKQTSDRAAGWSTKNIQNRVASAFCRATGCGSRRSVAAVQLLRTAPIKVIGKAFFCSDPATVHDKSRPSRPIDGPSCCPGRGRSCDRTCLPPQFVRNGNFETVGRRRSGGWRYQGSISPPRDFSKCEKARQMRAFAG